MVILSVCSARPNFVKLAAVHHALAATADVRHVIVHTGQHYDPLFSDIFFRELQIPLPDVNLGVRGGTDRSEVIDATAAAILPVLEKECPDWVLVYGDVNGALGAARSTTRCGLKLAHVEAGLRSFDPSMPEELNRIEIDRLADLLLVTEESGMRNIRKENLRGKPVLVGNTMIDTLVRMLPAIESTPLPKNLPGVFGVVTLHRPSNVDTRESLERNLRFFARIGEICPLVFPVHRRTQAAIDTFGLSKILPPAVHLLDPLGYREFLALVQRSAFILTDSGGIQEEAAFLGKRCFTLRLNTERPATIESGSNVLIDLTRLTDVESVFAFAKSPRDPAVRIPPLWDGKTGERIVEALLTLRAM